MPPLKDLRAEDITGSGSYLGAIYQEEGEGGGKFKKKKKRTTKKDKVGTESTEGGHHINALSA